MAHYPYYNTLPSWGTAQFQAITPPVPQYRPQSSWSGSDYFSAHSGVRDNSIFDYVWYKMRDFVLGTGYGRNQALHWWRRIYSGLVDPSVALPKEIGAAAGYEAIRLWEAHHSIYAAPLNANREREREALVGLAAAEATRLWAYTGRPYDKWGRLEASETAGATASRIFIQTYDYESAYQPYTRFPRLNSFSRRNSSSRRRAGTPNASPNKRWRPPTPYSRPAYVDTLASPISSAGTLNMAGMNAALPRARSLSPAALGSPLLSPYGGGSGRGYIPPPIDDFPNDFEDFEDEEEEEEEDEEFGLYGGGFGGEYGGTRGMMGGMGGMGGMGIRGGGRGMRGMGGMGTRGGAIGMGMGGGGMGMGGMGGMGMGGMGGVGGMGEIPAGDYQMGGYPGIPNYQGGGLGGVGGGALGYGNGMLGPGLESQAGLLNAGAVGYGGSPIGPSNITYDPVLGPGIQGTYYPKMAAMQRMNSGAYGYPGASVGLPPPPGYNSGWPRRGLRRSRSYI